VKPIPAPGEVRRRSPLRLASRVLAWLLGAPLALAVIAYLVLLVTPIPLPFVGQQVRNFIAGSLPAGADIELGEMALALEDFAWPVIRFSPVTYTDAKSGAKVDMDALEVGFSPVRAFIGQPGASIAMVGPHIQVNQDLFGPRLSNFEVVPDQAGGRSTVRILEGEDAFPQVSFQSDGVEFRGDIPESAMQMRSDNDWLIYNLEGAGSGLAAIIEQAKLGRFSRLVIRDGTLDMNDALYGLFRTFDDITFDVTPSPDGKVASGLFSADFGGTVMNGILERVEDGDVARLKASVTNLDLASFMPFINDPEGMGGVVGASALSIDVGFDAATGKIRDGLFHLDLTGTDLRIEGDYFPIATSIMEIGWDPQNGQFNMAESQITVGQSTGRVSGVFVLGMDASYGPTVAMSTQGRDIYIAAEDGLPTEPFSEMSFRGWSAPLYGALGIDQFVAKKADGAQLAAKGRADMLRRGLGFELTVGGDGLSADDIKRIWPYMISPDTREWFVKNVLDGRITRSSMRYNFPVGTLATREADRPIPEGGLSIDITGVGVKIRPTETMAPITIEGETKLLVDDNNVTISGDGGTVTTSSGPISVANVAMVMASENTDERVIEISGDLSAGIPSLLALAKDQQPEALADSKLPIDINALDGDLSLSLVSTIILDKQGKTKKLDYAVNGLVQDFGSTAPLDNHTVAGGQLSFIASQDGFTVQGQAVVDGLPANLKIEGEIGENAPPPVMTLGATIAAADFKKMGFDVSEFIDGEITFAARPLSDGSIQLDADLRNASVDVKDLALSKAAGVPGTVRASIKQTGTKAEVTSVDVAFGDVRLVGGIVFDTEAGLQSAEFSQFALSEGDAAQLSVKPVNGGISVAVRGAQLDLKPLLNRFFSLGEGSGGPQATAFDQTVIVDAKLDRALGYYKTTAFNVDLGLTLRGADLQRVVLAAQFNNGASIAVTTNPAPQGKTLSVAFNDLGTVLRMINVYPNLEGGAGTLVLQTVESDKADYGKFTIKNFAVVDEAKVAEILNNDQQSRAMISRQNRLQFRSADVEFVRRKDRVEITDAVLAGDSVGGTARGFIYTDNRQYDITGTYVPLFGLNSVFQKLPIFGPLLGGREGEGLFGITFAIRGALAKPDFSVNPVSALAPGAFRRMFEYRAKEIPRVE
jgi:hypothetical protein